MRALAAAVAALVALAAGCLDELRPEVGPPNQAICTPGDSDESTPVRFETDILDGILRGEGIECYECHTAAGDSPIGLEISGLDLSGYDALRRGGSQSGAAIVRPGDPCGSLLLQKVSESPPFGARMPLGEAPLGAAARQLLHDWIAEGALP